MGNSIFGIGLSGLNAAQAGLVTTGHNIANAATPGYTRQVTTQASAIPQGTDAGFFGRGVQVESVRRIYSEFLSQQVLRAQAQASELGAYQAEIKKIDDLVADPSAGLSPALQDFFGGLQDLSNSPASLAARQAFLGTANTLVQRFNDIDARMVEIGGGINRQIETAVPAINAYAARIAESNQAILRAEASASGQPANDLLDQRDALIADLNREIGVTVVAQDDGSYNVFVGSGQALVVGAQSYALAAIPSASDPSHVAIGLVTPGGAVELPDDSLRGGSLGGLLAFRNESLAGVRSALGRIAITLAASFNDQHRLGQDLAGAPGTDFFTLPAMQASGYGGNSGSAVIAATLSDYASLTTSDYRLDYDGAAYTLTRLADGVQQSFASLPLTMDGFSLALAGGVPAAGDAFLIRPTLGAAVQLGIGLAEAARIAAAAPIRAAEGVTNAGSGRISAGSVNAPPPPDPNLGQPVTITFTGPATFDVTGAGTGNPAGLAYTPGMPVSFNGWTVELTGMPATGDTFTVGPNAGGVADSRNALLLAGLQFRSTVAGGAGTYQEAYSQIVSGIGTRAREINIRSEAQQHIVAQAATAQQSVSGVNLDEEAANLMRYQQAYQASGRVLEIASRIFDTVLDLGR